MSYSRQSPSPRYVALMDQYNALHSDGSEHREGGPENTFPGISLFPHIRRIRRLIEMCEASSILDYGAGKGLAYSLSPLDVPGVGRVDTLMDYWDVDYVHCYDPCYAPHAKLPEEQFDGVISTDVMEHCPEEDLPWIIGEMFGYARKFVFANIAAYPARMILPNGENAHITIRPLEWWTQVFATVGAQFPQIHWSIVVQCIVDRAEGRALLEQEASGGAQRC